MDLFRAVYDEFRHDLRHVAKCVMKITKCKCCKKKLAPVRGRPPSYCSAACRQRAYRKRQAVHPATRLIQGDLYKIRDDTARAKAAVKVLEELGNVVTLERRSGPPPKPPGPSLSLVGGGKKADPKSD